MTILGLDIGGANIKAATSSGQSSSHRFALWKHPKQLATFLKTDVMARYDHYQAIALTMTGELCDCFENKRDGVQFILDAVRSVVDNLEYSVYAVDGSFLEPDQCPEQHLRVAASNWHALANFSRRFLNENETGIMIDIGSTSCDIIPVSKAGVLSRGLTDTTRIQNQELIYTGSYRTPVCAVANQVDFRGERIVLAQEAFATMADVYLLLGELTQSANDDTADGRPLTPENSKRRLARMVCAELDEVTSQEVMEMARQIAQAQWKLILDGLIQVAGDGLIDTMICSGTGHFIVDALADTVDVKRRIHLNDLLGPGLCASAPAYAVAKLLEES